MNAALLADTAPAFINFAAHVTSLRRLYGIGLAIKLDSEAAGDNDATLAAVHDLLRLTTDVIQVVRQLESEDADATESDHEPVPLDALCFAARLDLRRSTRELEAAPIAERIERFERTRRRVLEALRAIAEACADPNASQLGHAEREVELEVAVRVRAMYGRMILGMRRSTPDDPDSVLGALRYVASALALAAGTPEFHLARASDRAVLRALRERVLAWARGDRVPRDGERLLDDVWAAVSLMRGISRRPELVAHDRALLAALAGVPAPDANWHADAQRLLGRDHEIDRLLVQPATPESLANLKTKLLVLVRGE